PARALGRAGLRAVRESLTAMARGAFGRATPWLLLALPLLLLFLFLLLPYLLTFFYSTTGATIGRLFNVKEVGLRNFQAVLSEDAPSFISVIAITAIFTAGTLLGSLALGTGL